MKKTKKTLVESKKTSIEPIKTPIENVKESLIKENKKTEELDLSIYKNLFSVIKDNEVDESKELIIKHLDKIIKKSKLDEKYLILFLYDDYDSIQNWHSNKIYSSLTSDCNSTQKDILLILFSGGGSIEPAYLISKCCKNFSKEKFVVAIPRQAKSAATLIALGAIEIHMGIMSELGPIDPQIGKYPALGLSQALDKLTAMSEKYPNASEMLSKYLSSKLDLQNLGYLERVTESAVQYAERLLSNKKFSYPAKAVSIASSLVYDYKDHKFVIDKDEAITILGKDIIKVNTEEYKLADEIHKFIQDVMSTYKILKRGEFCITGNLNKESIFIRIIKD
jgi:hypothetical protein